MRLSIVSTLFKSEEYVRDFVGQVCRQAKDLVGLDYELILVNDGSPDRSLDIATEMLSLYPDNIVILDLSRNFGHHAAILRGLAFSKGEYVFLIDSDLEENPSILRTFWEEITQSSNDLVYGIQVARADSLLNRIGATAYHFSSKSFGDVSVPMNTTTSRIMTRRYLNALLEFTETEVAIATLWHLVGFAQRAIPVQKKADSPSTYNFSARFWMLVETFIGVSPALGRFLFISGVVAASVGLAVFFGLLIFRLSGSVLLDGWVSTLGSIWLVGGFVILASGINSLYLSKALLEAKRRPRSIVREIKMGKN